MQYITIEQPHVFEKKNANANALMNVHTLGFFTNNFVSYILKKTPSNAVFIPKQRVLEIGKITS